MTDVIDFPQEGVSRQIAEAQRLANLAPGEWALWIDDRAKRLGIPRAKLEQSVKAILADRERKALQTQAEERRRERRVEKERAAAQRAQEKAAKAAEKQKARAFEQLIELPAREHEARLTELAKRLGEELQILRDEFSTFAANRETACAAARVAPWPEPVGTKALLAELETHVRRYVVLNDNAAMAIALWTMFTWIHEEAAVHSPLLIVSSAEPDSGKTTLLGALGFLTPRPYHVVEASSASVFRIVDHLNPTLFSDDADRLFQRKQDLAHIFNGGWTRGTRIPRVVGGSIYFFNIFCPKVIGMIGLTLPKATITRAVVIKLWPMKPDEKIADFAFVDDDDFAQLRRKLLRWSNDNAAGLKHVHPAMPPGFSNRLAANWRLLLAIADLAGAGQRARKAAVELSRKRRQLSEGQRLLAAIDVVLGADKMITSDELQRRLTADPNAEWCEFRNHGPISKRQIAVLLEPYEIRPDVIHPTRRSDFSKRGYLAEWFVEAFTRYLPAKRTSVHSQRRRK